MSRKERDIFDLQLDELDRHLIEQPKAVKNASAELAEAKKDAAELKAQLDVTKAEAELKVAKNPEKFGLEKATGALISATVETLKSVQQVTKALLEVRHRVEVLSALMTSLDHRKYALQDLVKLHGQDYFSPVTMTAEEQEEMERRSQLSVKERVAERKRRRREERDST